MNDKVRDTTSEAQHSLVKEKREMEVSVHSLESLGAQRGRRLGGGVYSDIYELVGESDKVVKVMSLSTNSVTETSMASVVRGHPNLVGIDGIRLFTNGLVPIPRGPSCLPVTSHPSDRSVCTLALEVVMARATMDLYCCTPLTKSNRVIAKLICYQIVRALLSLRQRNIIHRDIKPENVLVYETRFCEIPSSTEALRIVGGRGVVHPNKLRRSDCSLKGSDESSYSGSPESVGSTKVEYFRVALADYGLSIFAPLGELEGRKCMTGGLYSFWYRSPEVCCEEAYGFPSEIWALACMVYEVCMGRSLMMGTPQDEARLKTQEGRDERVEYLGAQVARAVACLRHTDPDLADLLMNAMRVDPVTRLDIYGLERHPWFDDVRNVICEAMPIVPVVSIDSSWSPRLHSRVASLRLRQVSVVRRREAIDWRRSTIFRGILASSGRAAYPRTCLLMDLANNDERNDDIDRCDLASACVMLVSYSTNREYSGPTTSSMRACAGVLRSCGGCVDIATRDDWLRLRDATNWILSLGWDSWSVNLVGHSEERIAEACMNPRNLIPADLVRELEGR